MCSSHGIGLSLFSNVIPLLQRQTSISFPTSAIKSINYWDMQLHAGKDNLTHLKRSGTSITSEQNVHDCTAPVSPIHQPFNAGLLSSADPGTQVRGSTLASYKCRNIGFKPLSH